MDYLRRTVVAAALAIGVGLFAAGMVSAQRYTSPSYNIDASVGNSFGGDQSSTNYRLTSSGGESIIGGGAGGSYILGAGYVAQLDKSLQLTVQPTGLSHYYPFDEMTGTAVNDQSNSNTNGQITNTPTWVAGKVDGGLDLASSPDRHVTIPITWTPPANWSVSFWIYPRSASDYNQQIHSAGDWTGFMFQASSGGGLYVGTDMSTRFTPSDIGNITLNQWQQYTYTMTNGTARFYKNGALLATKTQTASPAWTGFELGGSGSAGNNVDGVIDELKIFSRALSNNEVKAKYDAGAAGNAAGLSFANNLIPGASQTAGADAIVQTDAPGYTLMLSQNQDLSAGGDSIPSVDNGGTIGSPVAWAESTTKGLGFTLTGTSATSLPGKWGTSPNYAYAAVPGSSTSFYARTGYTAGGKDMIGISYRVDVSSSQAAGTYSNTVTYTGVMTP